MVFKFYKYSMQLARQTFRLFSTNRISNTDLYFIGQGYQNSNCPALLKHHFLTNPHIYTPYTPYQAEISQGRLELQYNYQEMVKQNILFSNAVLISFSHTESDIKKTIKAADNAFKFVKDNINNIDNALEGKRSIDIFRKNT